MMSCLMISIALEKLSNWVYPIYSVSPTITGHNCNVTHWASFSLKGPGPGWKNYIHLLLHSGMSFPTCCGINATCTSEKFLFNSRYLSVHLLTSFWNLFCDTLFRLYSKLPPYQGIQRIQGKSGHFFNQGKSGEKERYFEKSGKVREVIELLLFHFREVTL